MSKPTFSTASLTAWISMVKFLKVIAYVLIGGVVIVGALLLWFDRSKDIDFTVYHPDVWVTCNGKINKDSVEYAQLNKWLQLNNSNWQNYVATAAPGYFYKSDDITIHVYKHGVVVNYYDGQKWSQVQKSVDTKEIHGTCKSS
jgi:hypothetical protein